MERLRVDSTRTDADFRAPYVTNFLLIFAICACSCLVRVEQGVRLRCNARRKIASAWSSPMGLLKRANSWRTNCGIFLQGRKSSDRCRVCRRFAGKKARFAFKLQ